MNKVLLSLALVLVFAPFALAHKGHTVKVMGTVAAVDGSHVTITTTAGKTSMVVLDAETKVVKGKVAQKAADIKVGARIVVAAADVKGKDGKITLIAKLVTLAAAPTTAAKK